jgi:glycosyltransferase involved in cell wall biosynthesis
MVMLEALACGTPVVGTPCGAAPEIVDDGVTGLLREDTDALVAAVRDVGRLDRLACRAAAELRFSMPRMAADHAAAYRSLLGTKAADEAELADLLRDGHDGASGDLVGAG